MGVLLLNTAISFDSRLHPINCLCATEAEFNSLPASKNLKLPRQTQRWDTQAGTGALLHLKLCVTWKASEQRWLKEDFKVEICRERTVAISA
jgi:hypothetical protein